MKIYKILKNAEIIESEIPGKFAGWKVGKIFGTLECKSGMMMKKENRVFFQDMGNAINEGYRPCKKCKPMTQENFEKYENIIPSRSLEKFYDQDKR